jgi:hypothetical protein
MRIKEEVFPPLKGGEVCWRTFLNWFPKALRCQKDL